MPLPAGVGQGAAVRPQPGTSPIGQALMPPQRNPFMQGPGMGGNGFVPPGAIPGQQPMPPSPNQPPAPGRQFPTGGFSTGNGAGGGAVLAQPNANAGGTPQGSAGPGRGPRPIGTGETQAGYDKRAGNWQMSQDRLASVGIKGGINKATPAQLAAFQKKYGKMPAGYKGTAPSAQATAGLANGSGRGAGAKERTMQAM